MTDRTAQGTSCSWSPSARRASSIASSSSSARRSSRARSRPAAGLPNERELADALHVNRAGRSRGAQAPRVPRARSRCGTGRAPSCRSSSRLVGAAGGRGAAARPGGRDARPARAAPRVPPARHALGGRAWPRAIAATSSWSRARTLLDDEAAEGADPKRALEIDLRWNALLGEATGNLMYQLVTNLFTKLVARLGPLYYNDDRDHQRSMTNHRAMLQAIEARDPDAAVRLVDEMLRYSEERDPQRGAAPRDGRSDRSRRSRAVIARERCAGTAGAGSASRRT